MRNFLHFGIVVASLALAASGQAQTYDDGTTSIDSTNCRAVVGRAEIDGTVQQIVGRACLQADGTWQIMQSTDGSMIWYPLAAYPYPDPWWWGAPIFIGTGVRFIFVDRYHHFHRFGGPVGAGHHHGVFTGGGMHGFGGMGRR
jgi:surface antigen